MEVNETKLRNERSYEKMVVYI